MHPKVLFIVVQLNVGGIETYLLRFLKFFNQKISSTVLCKRGIEGSLMEEYKKYGCEVELRTIGYYSIKSWIKFYRYLKKEQFDTICDFTGDFAGVALLIAKLVGVNNRIVFYRGSSYQFKSTFLKTVYARISNFLVKNMSTKILSNSIAAFNTFFPKRNKNDEKYQIIYNGIYLGKKTKSQENLRKHYTIPHNAFVVGHVGRFANAKNHKTIIEVANVLCKKYDDIYFHLCGKGVGEGLKSLIEEYNLQNRIITPGVCNNIIEHYQIMNMYIFPSFNEGQPNALLEALIMGLPVVASNIPSIIESVPQELKSILFSPMETESFVNSIEHIKKGNYSYNVEEVQSWAKKKYNPDTRFKDFLQTLVIK